MPPELTTLALAGLLQVAQYALFAARANLELGTGYTSGPRDHPPARAMSVRTGRMQRAMTNHFEALILFTLAVVVVTLADQSTPLTRTAAWVYLSARVLYVPAYIQGWRPWRSAIWGVGFCATVSLLVAALI